MRCVTFHNGELTPGIKTSLSEKQKRRMIFFGAKGMGCMCGLVFFDEEEPPDVHEDGNVYLAYPGTKPYRTKTKKLKEGVILKKAFRSPTKILLRVNTSTKSKKLINGRWSEAGGWPKEWVKSHGITRIFNSKGYPSYQRWADDLIEMDDQDVIKITLAGFGRSGRMIVRNDCGELSCLPERDYYEIVQAHERELEMMKAQQKLAAETVEETPKIEVFETVEANVNELEDQKLSEPESIETKSTDEVEKDKAIQDHETIIHTEEGETIGA